MGFVPDEAPIIFQLYSEEMQKFRLAARGHGAVQPPDDQRARVEKYFDPLPIWYPPFEDDVEGADAYPLHAITQRPMAMYHSWGSQNAWLRQIHASNRLYVPRGAAAPLGIADDDWVWLVSRTGRIKVQVRLMEGVNENTVWAWNGIGKRAGAWNLGPGVPETRRGFLLNHLIDDALPARGGGGRSGSDPVTGQAAWYDLRVRIEPLAPGESAGEAEETAPQFAALALPPGLPARPKILRYGASFRKARDG